MATTLILDSVITTEPGTDWAWVHLNKGLRAKIDVDDIPLIEGKLWFNVGTGKGTSTGYCGRSYQGSTLGMHREILGLAPGDPLEVDHINHDGLDNRRHNLRLATRSQNQANRRSSSKNGYRGIQRRGKRWVAIVRKKVVGRFLFKRSAARAYNHAALEIWGEFATLNEL